MEKIKSTKYKTDMPRSIGKQSPGNRRVSPGEEKGGYGILSVCLSDPFRSMVRTPLDIVRVINANVSMGKLSVHKSTNIRIITAVGTD